MDPGASGRGTPSSAGDAATSGRRRGGMAFGAVPCICDHAECELPAADGKRFCPRHLEDLGLLLASVPIKCPDCGACAQEGLLHHRCDAPGPQPESREVVQVATSEGGPTKGLSRPGPRSGTETRPRRVRPTSLRLSARRQRCRPNRTNRAPNNHAQLPSCSWPNVRSRICAPFGVSASPVAGALGLGIGLPQCVLDDFEVLLGSCHSP